MTTRTQRGSILIYALLTMSSMLAIGLALSGLFVSKLRLSGSARDSVAAIAVADSGVERCLYEARTGALPPGAAMTLQTDAILTLTDKATNAVVPDCRALSGAPNTFRFLSVGTYRGVIRALEISQ